MRIFVAVVLVTLLKGKVARTLVEMGLYWRVSAMTATQRMEMDVQVAAKFRLTINVK